MSVLFWSAFSLQALVMGVDEFHFHWKRNLPRWERWGHPVDTFFFLLPFGLLSFFPATSPYKQIYIFLSIVSCLVITKDEWIHRETASPMENWLHSLLFVLHPAILFSAYFLWPERPWFFSFLFFSVLVFLIYQLLFWNYYADRILKKRLKSY